jgi:tRNA (mo5U34)-methyltransferase
VSESLADEVAAVPFWWHSIDLGHGVVTPGHKSPELLESELANARLGDLSGKSVLDLGAWDGWFSFAAERLGASRVVALDHYVWKLELTEHGVPGDQPFAPEDAVPGRAGFDLAHRALNSRVEPVVADLETADLSGLGEFDVVLFLGVLYHMQNPLAVLRKPRALTRGVLVLETEAIVVRGYEHTAICEFYPGIELNQDVTNWWAPNGRAVEGMCRAAGFAEVTTINGPPPIPQVPAAYVHAYKVRSNFPIARTGSPSTTAIFSRRGNGGLGS